MPIFRFSLTLFIVSCAYSFTSVAEEFSLHSALTQVYRENPTLEAERAALRASSERKAQARAGWLPNAEIDITRGTQEIGRKGFPEQDNLSSTQRLTFSQPLFSGGGTVAAMHQADADIAAAEEQLHALEQQLFFDTITAYMDVVHAQEVVTLARSNEAILRSHHDAAEKKLRVGEATKTDVAQAHSRHSRALSDRIKAEGDLAIARAGFQRIVGVESYTLVPPEALPLLPATDEETLIQIARAENPVLARSEKKLKAAESAISEAQSKLLPSLSLEASRAHQDESTSYSFGRQESMSNNVLLRFRIPLFQAGRDYSDIRLAKENAIKNKYEIRVAERSATENVTKAFAQWQSTQASIEAHKVHLEAATLAKNGMEREAEFGARTLPEVLDATQELFDAQVQLAQAKRQEHVTAYHVLLQIGRLTPEYLGISEEP